MAELYLFNDDGTKYGFVNGFTAITYDAITYEPTLIKRTRLTLSDNIAKSPVSFFFSRSHFLARKLLNVISEVPTEVTITDSDTGGIIWSGVVLKPKANLTNIEIICDSSWAAQIRSGHRYIISPQCQHMVYSTACGVNPELFRENILDVTVTGSTSLVIAGSSKPSAYYNNGIIEFKNSSRRILKQVDSLFYLSAPFTNLGTGTVSLWPGCNLTSKNCLKFNNLDNQLAFEFSPNKSPFKLGLLNV